jgi:hypothetical protein
VRGYSFGSSISELKGEFFCSVSRVCRRDDPSGPEAAPYDGGVVDGVGTVKSEDVPLLPIPVCLETSAKFNGGTADLCIRVRAAGLRVEEDYCDNWVQARRVMTVVGSCLPLSSGNFRPLLSKSSSQISSLRKSIGGYEDSIGMLKVIGKIF